MNYTDIFKTRVLNFTDGSNKIMVEYHNGTWLVRLQYKFNQQAYVLLDLSSPVQQKMNDDYIAFAKYYLGVFE